MEIFGSNTSLVSRVQISTMSYLNSSLSSFQKEISPNALQLPHMNP